MLQTRYDWVGKEIHWELGKKIFKMSIKTKQHMHKPESILENESYKILWDFEILMYPLILARKPDQVSIYKKKRTCCLVDLAVSGGYRVKITESEMVDKYSNLARELKKTAEHESNSDAINVLGAFLKGLK